MITFWIDDGQIDITAPKTKEDFVQEEAEKMGLTIVKAPEIRECSQDEVAEAINRLASMIESAGEENRQ